MSCGLKKPNSLKWASFGVLNFPRWLEPAHHYNKPISLKQVLLGVFEPFHEVWNAKNHENKFKALK